MVEQFSGRETKQEQEPQESALHQFAARHFDCKDWDTFFSAKTAAHVAEGAALGAVTIGWIPGITPAGGAFVGGVGALGVTAACKMQEAGLMNEKGIHLPPLEITIRQIY
jgi:hypothetical protein